MSAKEFSLTRWCERLFPAGARLLACFLLAMPLVSQADRLPQRAVDTAEIPEIVISVRDSDRKPLPYYRVAPDVYFLYGNIAEVDRKNCGFNGNVGFVVTDEGVWW